MLVTATLSSSFRSGEVLVSWFRKSLFKMNEVRIIKASEVWQISDISKRHWNVKIVLTKNSRGECLLPFSLECCVFPCDIKTSRLFRYQFYLLYWLVLGLSYSRKNINWGWLKKCAEFGFGPLKGKLTGTWGNMHSEELSVICILHQVLMVMKPRRMRWAARVGGVDKTKNVYAHFKGGHMGDRA